MTDINDVLDNMDEDDRLLFLSAREVKNSKFWSEMLATMDQHAMEATSVMMTKLMEGDEKAALVAAAKIQGIDWVLRTMDDITQDVEDEALNQG